MTDHDPFEDRLRETLRSGDGSADRPDVDSFLGDVHRGARSRQRRWIVGAAAAAVLAVAGGGAAAGTFGVFQGNEAPVADQTTEPTTAPTTTYSSNQVLNYTSRNTKVISLTSTGREHQWALTVTESDECAPTCVSVFTRSPDTGAWGTPALLPIPRNPSAADRVSQLRYVGDASSGYDGWAFGRALLSIHGIDGPTPSLWERIDVGGSVVSLEAHGGTVYALVVDESGMPKLMASPIDRDAFDAVDTGPLEEASNLVATAGVVAFLDKTASGTDVMSSTADPTTGLATGDWTRSQPCQSGSEPTQLSSSSDTLWALCTNDANDTVAVATAGNGTWTQIPYSTGPGSSLTARSTDTAVLHLADNTKLMLVTANGATTLGTAAPPFRDPTMLGFTNQDLGFAVAAGVLWRTEDGGATWSEEQVVPPAG
jgi:hypothetical protein